MNIQICQQDGVRLAHVTEKGEMVVMLCYGALKFLGRASLAIQVGSLEEAHNNLIRSQEVLLELMNSLDMAAGDIAENLLKLYEYMHHRLVEANLKKERAPIDEVASLLSQLLSAWKVAAENIVVDEDLAS